LLFPQVLGHQDKSGRYNLCMIVSANEVHKLIMTHGDPHLTENFIARGVALRLRRSVVTHAKVFHFCSFKVRMAAGDDRVL
jgi:hypothetical protein